MSSDRRIMIETLPADVPNMVIEIEVYHSKGGMNYWSGNQEPAAYWVSVQPVTIKDGFKTITLGGDRSGIKGMIETAPRFNAKRLKQLADTVKDTEVYQRCLDRVTSRLPLPPREPSLV